MGFRIVSEVGTRLPLHCTSQGKVILSNQPGYTAERLLHKQPLAAYTAHTLTSAEKLLTSLESIRQAGFAEEHEEYKLGLKSVAAPIFDAAGECRYAIGVICMAAQSDERFEAMKRAVLTAAAAISTNLQKHP